MVVNCNNIPCIQGDRHFLGNFTVVQEGPVGGGINQPSREIGKGRLSTLDWKRDSILFLICEENGSMMGGDVGGMDTDISFTNKQQQETSEWWGRRDVRGDRSEVGGFEENTTEPTDRPKRH